MNYKNVLLLCLCAAYSHATTEDFFSYMKVVETDWQIFLNGESLESLLHIKVSSPSVFVS